MDVSVLIATSNRIDSLLRTLQNIEDQYLDGASCEVVIVENGSDTLRLDSFSNSSMTFRTIKQTRAGRARALNTALDVSHGELLLFTDDDVTLPTHWIRELRAASLRHPDCPVFCGPIVPLFPVGTPDWLSKHAFRLHFFVDFTPDLPEGPLPFGHLGAGPNFAVRSRAVRRIRFREDLGPSAKNGALTGDDTEFLHRLRQRTGPAVYVPDAPVLHHIRAEQIETPWLLERAFHLGRTMATLNPEMLRPIRVELDSRPTQDETPAPSKMLQVSAILNYYLGQLYQREATKIGQRHVARLYSFLGELEKEYIHTIGPSASKYLSTQPKLFFLTATRLNFCE